MVGAVWFLVLGINAPPQGVPVGSPGFSRKTSFVCIFKIGFSLHVLKFCAFVVNGVLPASSVHLRSPGIINATAMMRCFMAESPWDGGLTRQNIGKFLCKMCSHQNGQRVVGSNALDMHR